MQITKDMTIYEIIKMDADVAPIFYSYGMHCLGCPISRGETLAEAAAAHGIDIEAMLSDLNNHFAEK